ncbi:MAG: hypothetical protein QG628_452 [Patescibacteria group bacterium]|nr:hypothetical protein [Patescibacteria group bacterium]
MSARKIWSNNQWVEIDALTINGIETIANASEAIDPAKLYFVAAGASPGGLINIRINGKLGSGIWFGGSELWTPPVLAVGGVEADILVAGTPYRVHMFTENLDFEVLATTLEVEYLLVGGGGAGGTGSYASYRRGGGGGGAGGILQDTMLFTTGIYPVNIGQGGQPGTGAASSRTGSDTTLNGLIAYGGGGGGGAGGTAGANGGSGGGASAQSGSVAASVGVSLSGQGNNGGSGGFGNFERPGGGGGSDVSAGLSWGQGTAGGASLVTDFWGGSVSVAKGGNAANGIDGIGADATGGAGSGGNAGGASGNVGQSGSAGLPGIVGVRYPLA